MATDAPPRLSVTILTKDNADTLEMVLGSAQFADEVVIVDSGSQDGTLELAARFGARIVRNPLRDFATQRNLAWTEAAGEWVFTLDSDEVVNSELAAAILEATRRPADGPGPRGFEVRVRNYFLGRPLEGGGLDADYHLRLAVRAESRWEGEIHERLVVQGEVGRLRGCIEHHTATTMESRLRKTLRYARARGEEMRRQGQIVGHWRAVYLALRFFLGRLLVRGGYRDGFRGVIWWWLLATELLLAHFYAAGDEAASRAPHA